MNKLKFFLDTEFIEAGRHHPLYLLSIGIVCESYGRSYYAENIEAPIELANDFVKEKVFPNLSLIAILGDGVNDTKYYQKNYAEQKDVDEHLLFPSHIASSLEQFIWNCCHSFALNNNFSMDEIKPEFWGYFCDYDWVLFCQSFGTMSELPKGFPYYCNDLKQIMKLVGEKKSLDELTDRKSNHNALSDAKQIKEGFEIIRSGLKNGLYKWPEEL
jgi:hypothetical protein